MLEYQSISSHTIIGRGQVFVVINDKDRNSENTGLIGETVKIDGESYSIRGVEYQGYKGLRKGAQIALVVRSNELK